MAGDSFSNYHGVSAMTKYTQRGIFSKAKPILFAISGIFYAQTEMKKVVSKKKGKYGKKKINSFYSIVPVQDFGIDGTNFTRFSRSGLYAKFLL